MHVDVLGVSNRSRAPKRTESRTTRSPYQSKSPKRSGNATGSRDAEDTLFSGHQMTADERLEQLLSQNNMRVTERGERGRINEPNVVGSPSRRHVSPLIAIQMNSPPRELTRALPSEPQNIPITDVTSDENGRDVMGSVRSPYGRKAAMGHEISELTQKQLTAEVAIAEMANQRVEAEVRQSNLEHELSQEVHMFNIARALITEMRTAFDIEDQGCIRRIEMLETQRNEYASGLVELGNKAEMVLHERNMEYNEEIRRLKYRSETYVGQQNEEISRLRYELTAYNDELQQSINNRTQLVHADKEASYRISVLSSEVSAQKANTHHLEIEVSQMQDSMRDRNAIFNSEIANLQSSIRSERELQLQKSGFTEQEIAAFLSRKIHEAVDESKREILSLETMLNCEGEVARLYKGRFEEITKVTSGMDSETKTLTLALKDRLDREVSASGSKEATISELRDEVEDVRKQYRMEKWQADLNERNKDKFLKELSEQERANQKSNREIEEQNKKVEHLESETERLRDDRNEHKAYCQQLYEELWGNGGYGEHEEAEAEKTERGEALKAEASRISRREADKIVVPHWPKSHDLDGWKSQLLSNVLSACADTDQEAWISWLGEAFKLDPDIKGMSNSGGSRFTTIDVKLANALNAMIASSEDSGREIGMEIKVMTLDMARKDPPEVVRGRQIVAMILDSFRSATHTDLAFTGKHLYELTYPGDNKLSLFKNQWIHILSAMREDDKPRGLALRDILFDKIKGSSSMALDIRYYKKNPEGHPEKTYEYLMEMINRTIATEREEKNRLEKLKGVNQIVSNPKALAAEKPGKKDDNTKADKTPKANENAAPVLTKPNPKAHNENEKGKGKYEKGKGKGKGKDRDKSRARPPSVDRKNIPCVYHFQKGGCSKGKDCPFSHSKKRGPCGSSFGPGNRKGTPRNDRPKSDKPCFLYAKGKCDRMDCPYKHDNSAAPAESGSPKAKAVAPKGKAKAAVAKAKSAAVVVQVKPGDNNGYLSDWSDNEDPSPVAASKTFDRHRIHHVRKDKVVKIKRRPETIRFDIGVNTNGLPKRTKRRENRPRYVKRDFLESETFKHQTAVDHLLARARAKVLSNEIMGKKPEIKVMIGKDVYVKVQWRNDKILEEMMKTGNKRNQRKQSSCVPAEPLTKSVRFIMDTGCGHDLISQRKVKELGLETFLDNDGMTFMTANGLTDSNEITVMDHEGLGQCKLHVLNQTPAVLSIGSRCSKEGYSFIWPEGEDMKPAMINDESVCTFLEVDGDIPYLIPGSIPKDDEMKENRTKIIGHLESLISKKRAKEQKDQDEKPIAAAGEEPDDDPPEPSSEEEIEERKDVPESGELKGRMNRKPDLRKIMMD